MRRIHLLPLLGWTALWLLFFLTILIGSHRLPTGDFTDQFHTFAAFEANEMAQGRLPLFTPHTRAGLPFAADP